MLALPTKTQRGLSHQPGTTTANSRLRSLDAVLDPANWIEARPHDFLQAHEWHTNSTVTHMQNLSHPPSGSSSGGLLRILDSPPSATPTSTKTPTNSSADVRRPPGGSFNFRSNRHHRIQPTSPPSPEFLPSLPSLYGSRGRPFSALSASNSRPSSSSRQAPGGNTWYFLSDGAVAALPTPSPTPPTTSGGAEVAAVEKTAADRAGLVTLPPPGRRRRARSSRMANPVGEDSWVAYAEEASRHAGDLEKRVEVVELFKRAVVAEPGSLKVYLAYCEYFWSLHMDAQSDDAGWPAEEQELGRELFSLGAALALWQQGYEAVQWRLGDSHELWDRWVALEMEMLARTRGTDQGVRRITHLFRDRLQMPHARWDDTAQTFSGFLSEHSRAAYEDTMREATAAAQEAKLLYEPRDPFEMRLAKAARMAGADEELKTVMREYIEWEVMQSKRNHKKPEVALELCLGLWARALTGIFATDEAAWTDYVVYLSTSYTHFELQQRQPTHGRKFTATQQKQHQEQQQALAALLPNMRDVLERAVAHCPWSGPLWARYILSAEEAGLPFADVAQIKHSATSAGQLDRDGMSGVLDMYVAWCGYLKRSAMGERAADHAHGNGAGGSSANDATSPAGTAASLEDESVDLADVGLSAALEDVQLWGERLYKEEYKGDPNFRLERILIQYLTEKKGAINEARDQWDRLAEKPLLIDSYDFWLHYYMWELMVFTTGGDKAAGSGSASGSSGEKGKAHDTAGKDPISNKNPARATDVLARAVNRRTMDWPERILEVYLQHCNDYEVPAALRNGTDTVFKVRKALTRRREKEAAEAYAKQQQQYAQQQREHQEQERDQERRTANAQDDQEVASPSGAKRKREGSPSGEAHSKRPKNDGPGPNGSVAAATSEGPREQQPVRDREHTSVLVSNLPADVTATKVKSYFKDYGHISNLMVAADPLSKSSPKTAAALIEFRSVEEARSALLRDGKYFGDHQLAVEPGTDLTVFVTNYPPSADESYIRKLFASGSDGADDEVLSVRLPSLKYNAQRRFCYVSFRTRSAAQRAVAKSGTLLKDEDGPANKLKYKLEVALSDPAARQKRAGATAEGRELYVAGIDRSANESDLRAIFEKFGTLEGDGIRLLRNVAGRSRGSGFVVFEKKDDAETAAKELDKTKFRGMILAVDVAREKGYRPVARSGAGVGSRGQTPSEVAQSPTADGQPPNGRAADTPMAGTDEPSATARRSADPTPAAIAARTISLLGVPETMNDARVRALISSSLQGGDTAKTTAAVIARLTLHPDRGGAIVEFADEATASRAALSLNGKEVDGDGGNKITLRTGERKDLFAGPPRQTTASAPTAGAAKPGKSTATSASTAAKKFMPLPAMLARPRPAGPGGPKRGLGFAGTINKSKAAADTADAATSSGDTTGTTGTKKSNADFQALFLGSGGIGKGKGKEKAEGTNGDGAHDSKA